MTDRQTPRGGDARSPEQAAPQSPPQTPWRDLAGVQPVRGAPEPPSAPVLLLNLIPVLHMAVCAACAIRINGNAWKLVGFLLSLYVLPPLAVRLALALAGRPEGLLRQHSRGFLVWWWATQWQTVFNRLPWLEELLRLVPGMYPLWIRLWGGCMSLQTYVAPGAQIVDRWAVQVQAGAVLGLRCVLAGHLGTRDVAGRAVVIVAAPCVQAHAIVGGFAMLGPGAVLRAGQVLPVGRHLGPYAQWPRSAAPAAAPMPDQEDTP